MGTHRFTVDVGAPAAVVYDLWTDLERVGEWIEGISRVEAPARWATAGMSYVLWFGRVRSEVEVELADPPRLIRSRSRSRFLSTDTETTFEPLPGGGTRVTETFRTHGIVAGLVARMFALGSYKGSFRGELLAFKRVCEAA